MQNSKQRNTIPFKRAYNATEIAQYEYCPLVWWHEQYDPIVHANNEELFAQMVEIEQEYGSQAPHVPDYQVIEQILVRRGAFEQEYQATRQLPEMDDEALEEEYDEAVGNHPRVRRLLSLALVMLGFGIVLVGLSLVTLFLKLFTTTMFGEVIFVAGIALLIFSVACFALLFNERRVQREKLVREHHQALGLPFGELMYENVDGRGDPITSDEHFLQGKPAYIVKLPDNRLLPVDIKPVALNAMTPEGHHVLQVAAYCLILEEYSEDPPTHGILRYSDREFPIEYTPALRKKVLRHLKQMDLSSAEMPPALQKQKVAKCRACIYQPICPIGQSK
ncbi:hypothetical protein KDH_57210 [Dictyobacter sp. S3.2.2.5]|uniref:DUF83 domain-containing protein n=1 Tax=Dictyobacter halimunensis TaxID=3026934 RepID=A0ABQ6G0V6_9CHLR|nr:hypothetical protein KDH_57210 [Dictyobacter sp. S3.2.2.5]